MDRVGHLVLLVLTGGCLGSCGAIEAYVGEPTDTYSIATADSQHAIPSRRDKRKFHLDGSSIVIVPMPTFDYPHTGLSLAPSATGDEPRVSNDTTFSYMVALNVDRSSILVVDLDEYLVRVRGSDKAVAPTHFNTARASCVFIKEEGKIRVTGKTCYVYLYYEGIPPFVDGYTLAPASIDVDGTVYSFPDIVYEPR